MILPDRRDVDAFSIALTHGGRAGFSPFNIPFAPLLVARLRG
jgi:hypothetical protein